MDYITIDTLRKLQEVGFSYPEYEHFLNIGMLFFIDGDEYLIGGCGDVFTERDEEVAKHGEWLPDATQLLSWLKNTGFVVAFAVDEEGYYSAQAKDMKNETLYIGGDYTLANALAKVIYKICKSKRREYVPQATLRLEITENPNMPDSSL